MTRAPTQGFSVVEVLVALTVSALALSGVLLMFTATAYQHTSAIHHWRAAMLSQSVAECLEITADPSSPLVAAFRQTARSSLPGGDLTIQAPLNSGDPVRIRVTWRDPRLPVQRMFDLEVSL